MTRLLFWILASVPIISSGQCKVSDYILDNYTWDAKILLLRDIQANPDDPDYNEPFLDESRLDFYLERLSALHANEIAEPMLDSIFGPLQIHVNPEESEPVYYRRIIMGAPYDPSWVDPFLATGVSGNPEFDALITTYDFEVDSSIITSAGMFLLWMDSNADVLNMIPIANAFTALDIIEGAEPSVDIDDRFNYTGVPFRFPSGDIAEAGDISFSGDQVRFSIMGGDCFSGCFLRETWTFSVSETCEVNYLNVPEFETNQIVVYPNPAAEVINIDGLMDRAKLELFSLNGSKVNVPRIGANKLDVSSLNPGAYFLRIIDEKGRIVRKTVIVN